MLLFMTIQAADRSSITLVSEMNGSRHGKRSFGHANSEGPDQPAHLRRLIRAFALRIQNRCLLQSRSNEESSD